MQGMVTQTRDRPLLRPSIVTKCLRSVDGSSAIIGWNANEMTMPQTTTSFRSGPAYVDAINSGATILPDDTSSFGRILGDTGHPFKTQTWSAFTDTPMVNWGPSSLGRRYSGLILVSPNFSFLPGAISSGGYMPKAFTTAELNFLGSDLISRAQPLKSQADVLQALVELLREGLPHALFESMVSIRHDGTKSGIIRALGSDYLGHMFGLAPLIHDIDKLMRTVSKIDTLVRQLVKDDGKAIFRKRSLPSKETLSSIGGGIDSRFGCVFSPKTGPSTSLNAEDIQGRYTEVNGSMRYEGSVRDTLDVSFSGSFTYFLENLMLRDSDQSFWLSYRQNGPSRVDDSIRQHLLGIGEKAVNGKLLWELTPFSWLIDWFVNVGTVIDNRHVFDDLGLVMNYGYLMVGSTRSITSTYTVLGTGKTYSSRISVANKERVRANPFGFGLDEKSLSAYQISILAALATGAKSSRW